MLNIGENFRFTKYLQDINDYKPSQLFDLIYYDAFAPSAQDELWTVEMFQKCMICLMMAVVWLHIVLKEL